MIIVFPSKKLVSFQVKNGKTFFGRYVEDVLSIEPGSPIFAGIASQKCSGHAET